MDKNVKTDLKKEYLSKYLNYSRKEKELNEEIRQIRLSKMNPAFSADGMPKGSNITDLSDYAAILDEKERERDEIICQKNKYYKDLKERINLLEDEDEKQIMISKYLFGLRWNVICNGMNKESRKVFRIHGQALKNFRMEI